MFLVGIIPGPTEPSLEQINHLIAPLVDDLLQFYAPGVHYSQTIKYAQGRDVRLALVPVISDLPAIRQLIGFASHTSLTFCVFCPLNLRDISNIDYDSWGRRSSVEHKMHALKWRDAQTEKEREEITAKFGVRWSELLRLPYWDPIEFVTVDTMHGLFLGNLQHHCRMVWGMDIKFNDGDGSTSDPLGSTLMSSLDVQKAFVVIRKAPREAVQALKFKTLRLLAQERGLRRVHDGLADSTQRLVHPDPERFAIARRTNSERKKNRVLGRTRLNEIWSDMERTTIPSWLSAVPARIGEAKSGTVTADQWRTFCTIHLVVTMVRLWGIATEHSVSERERSMLDNFMHLIAATKLASMRTMTQARVQDFKDHMLRYLQGLLDLFPGIPLTPNLHNTMHLVDIFPRFGPSHGWRCWAFERW
ncbi:hypothetical protein DENSPDRAFT_768593, partial [Dentipellis sp. KUC8613]